MSIRHFSLSVTGTLAHKSNIKNMVNCITVDGKLLATAKEVKAFLESELALAHEMLPMSDECDNHDWLRGCMGHSDGKTYGN